MRSESSTVMKATASTTNAAPITLSAFIDRYNRGIKPKNKINKTKLSLKFSMNGLTIFIGQLELVQLTNRKTGRKVVNKQISIFC